jgi:spore maturation protein CgeB
MHVLSLAPIDDPHLLGSYARAFRAMGCNVSEFSLATAIEAHSRIGFVGRRVGSLFSIESWLRKGNRDLVVHLLELRPNLVLVPGPAPVLPGTLAQLKAALPECNFVLVWPDTLLNLPSSTIQCLPLYDLVASYSASAIPPMQRLGARLVEWVPFAADPFLFPKDVTIEPNERSRFECDVCFVGNWRPEREKLLVTLVSAGISVKVWGHPVWMKRCLDRRMADRYFQGGPLFGVDLAKAIRGAKLSLNPIDHTNFPAANMRFFESPACGATTLNSQCPEMTSLFVQGETAFYYNHEREALAVIKQLLSDGLLRMRVASAAQHLVLREHTYRHRAELILRKLPLPTS